jgi:hypothetical protein
MEDQGAQGGRSISCCGRYDAASLDNPNVIAAAQQGIAHEPPAWRRANGCARLFDFVVGDLFRALACRHA